MRAFTIRPGPRATALLASAAVLLLAAAPLAAMRAFGGIETALRWCNDRLIASASSREDAAVTLAVTVLAVAASVTLLRLAALVFREVSGRRSFERAISSREVVMPRNVRIAAADVARGIPVTTVDDERSFAVAVGLLAPRIVLSRALAARCTLAELRAVLAHEAAHCQARHPLRALLWESLRRAAFLAPTVGDIADHLALSRELEADAAARAAAGRRALVSAMLKATDVVPSFAAAAFGRLGDRAAALADGGPAPLRLRTASLVVTSAFLALLVSLSGALRARAASAPELCVSDMPAMSTINFSPYLSFAVTPTAAMPSTGARSDEVPLTPVAR